MKDWLTIALEPSVRLRALKVAVVVGLILAVINHGDSLLDGTMTLNAWIKVFLTFIVPYCVSTYASVEAIRHRKN